MNCVRSFSLAVALAALLAGCGGGAKTSPSPTPGPSPTPTPARVFQPLEFPFSNPGVIVRMASWGIPNWSGSDPHNGIDLVVDGRLTSAAIVSPTAGDVRSVTSAENPYSNPPGQLMVTIAIRVNDEWTVDLVLEPGTADPALKAAQIAAVRVQAGQVVSAGSAVADLLIGTLGYPHLHYMVERGTANVCAYAHSSESAKRTIESFIAYPNSNVPGGQICVGQ
jgi:hypothetical protein